MTGTDDPQPSSEPSLLCAKDQVALKPCKMDLTYQGHTFPADAFCCPICGLAYIPEEMAKGRMLEVEQTLEEK